MVDVVKQYTATYRDDFGRPLLGSDQVHSVEYKDNTLSSWRRDYSCIANPFFNHNFTEVTVTGSAPGNPGTGWYETGTNSSFYYNDPDSQYLKIFKVPIAFEDEVLAEKATLVSHTPSISSQPEIVTGSYFVNSSSATIPKNRFPLNYTSGYHSTSSPWATSSGIPGQPPAELVYELSSVTPVAGFLVDSYHGGATNDPDTFSSLVAEYELQVSSSLNEEAYYTTVASGTRYNWASPIWVEFPEVEAKFLRFRFKNNGNVSRTTLWRLFVYTQDVIDRGMSLAVTKVQGYDLADFLFFNGYTFFINQGVDFSEIDTFYYGITDYIEHNDDFTSCYVANNLEDSIQLPAARTGGNIYQVFSSRSVDVSGYTGEQTLTFKKFMGSPSRYSSDFLQLYDFQVSPSWFRELFSEKRGFSAKFPEKVLVISDSAGLSIVEADSMSLWMRFDLGSRKMLETLPTKVLMVDDKLYLGTTRGFYCINFTMDKMLRLDERGLFERHDISKRNVNCFDRATVYWAMVLPDPKRSVYDYVSASDTPSFDFPGVNDFDSGFDDVYGRFFVLGTPRGLVVVKGHLNKEVELFYSLDKDPVTKVKVSGSGVWYSQGLESSSRLNFIGDINNIVQDGFSSDASYRQSFGFYDDLSSSRKKDLTVHTQDLGVSVTYVGGCTVISGVETRTGSTGLEFFPRLPDASFTAKLKVRLNKIPVDSRGSFRFGVSNNHFNNGYFNVYSKDELGFGKAGYYISAHSVDPYGTPLLTAVPFDSVDATYNRGIELIHEEAHNYTVKAYPYTTSSGAVLSSSSSRTLPEYSVFNGGRQTFPQYKRDFSAKVGVKIAGGFSVYSSDTPKNNSVYFGLSKKDEFIAGTQHSSGDLIDAALIVCGNTTYSGSLVYNLGSYSSTYNLSDVVFTQPGIAVGELENSGSSPFREWQFDYIAASGIAMGYVDGEYVGARKWVGNQSAPVHGLVFGYTALDSSTVASKEVMVRDLIVTYPDFNPGSKGRYGLEETSELGFTSPVLYEVPATTLYLNGDAFPPSGTLSPSVRLRDGLYHDGLSYGMSSGTSIGFSLDGPSLLDAVYLYDTVSGTDGWASSSVKNVEVWSSEDSVLWNSLGVYDLSNVERTQGVTKFRFSPAVETANLKFTGLSSTFTVAGGSPWAITEVVPMAASGISYYGNDNTEGADFREWKLVYNKEESRLTAFIDEQLVGETNVSLPIAGSRLIISDDFGFAPGHDNGISVSVKDVSLEIEGDALLPYGTITSLDASRSTGEGVEVNDTVVLTTSSGVAVLDRSLLGIYTDGVKKYKFSEKVFGESSLARVSLADSGLTRDDGLVFVGTSTEVPSSYSIIDGRLKWYDAREQHGAWSPLIDYGNRSTLVYLPNIKKYHLSFDPGCSYSVLFDLDTGDALSIQRNDWYEKSGLSFSSPLIPDAASGAYCFYDEHVWMYAGDASPLKQNLSTGEVVFVSKALVSVSTVGVAGGRPAGAYEIVYSLHNNKMFTIFHNINSIDVSLSRVIPSYRYGVLSSTSSTSHGHYARGGSLPWNLSDSGSFRGSLTAVYSDYDRSIYCVAHDASFWTSTAYFARYDIDRDYIEVLGTRNETTLDWPYEDSDLYGPGSIPFVPTHEKSLRSVYDPVYNRIYFITSRSTAALFYVYDVVSQRWLETGEYPPVISPRNWPGGEPGDHEKDTNYIVYDNSRDAFLIAVGRGDEYGDKYYLYRPLRDTARATFDYLPSRDGIPTTSGNDSTHFTKGYGIFGDFSGSNTNLSKYLYYNSFYSDSAEWDFSLSGDTVTISGNNPGLRRTLDLCSYFSSPMPLDPVGDFEIKGEVALPSFSSSFPTSSSPDYPKVEFVVGASDTWGRRWSVEGREDPSGYQETAFVLGCSGVASSSASYPITVQARYSDGFNLYPYHSLTNTRYENAATPKQTISESPEFKEFRLNYSYLDDRIDAYYDGQHLGSLNTYRKFTGEGIRPFLGVEAQTDSQAAGKEWVVKIKNPSLARPSEVTVDSKGRLFTSLSGAVGDFYHERTFSVLAPSVSWVCEIDSYLPSHIYYPGYSYIASLVAVGDGTKLLELCALVGPSRKKRVAITGNLDNRHDHASYLAYAERQWDDLDLSKYKLVYDSSNEVVYVYFDSDSDPSLVVNYADLPDYKVKHLYYGRVNYGDWEKIYDSPSLTGTWAFNNPDHTGGSASSGKSSYNSTAYFSYVAEETNSKASFSLDPNLGTVSLYAFYYGMGYDSAFNVPYTVVSSGVNSLPTQVGLGKVISSVSSNTDEEGNFDASKTTVRVDQRRRFDNSGISTNYTKGSASGWVYLGTYIDPSEVIVTADATGATSSAKVQVCADAIGVDIGKYGRSSFDMSTGYVRLNTRTTHMPDNSRTSSGLSVIDVGDNRLVDFYGEDTAPSIAGASITTGKVEE